MLTYKFPYVYELVSKFPHALIWRKNSIRFLINELSTVRPSSILDVGCGTGSLVPILKKLYPQSQILGIDKSSHMINLAKRRYGRLTEFKVVDFFDYEGKHDLIVGFYSFGFFPLTHAIEKIKKLLTPGGICIIVTTTEAPFSVVHRFFVTKILRTNLWLYSPKEFCRSIQGMGFSLKMRLINEIEGSYIISLSYSE